MDRPPLVTPCRRVLVVDDNEDAADSLAALLALQGHEVSTAYSGPAGLGAVATFAPDVVFLNLRLAGLDGYEVARRLRAAAPHGGPTLVALTGLAADGDRRRSRAAGFDYHLVKPADPADVTALLAAPPPPRIPP